MSIFLTWIGSIIIYILLKDEDPKKAKKGAILGVLLTVVFVAVAIGVWGYFVIQEAIPQTVEELQQEHAEDIAAFNDCVDNTNYGIDICADVHLR